MNPVKRIKHLFGVAIDWRVRDVIESEREATVALGETFVQTSAEFLDRLDSIARRLDEIEERMTRLESEQR